MKKKWIVGIIIIPVLISASYLPTKAITKTNPKENLNEYVIEEIELGTDLYSNFGGAIVNDGSNDILYMWGDNDYGQLGDGTTESSTLPIAIDLNNDGNPYNEGQLSNLTLGSGHTGIVKENGTLFTATYAWGNNNHGQLGYSQNYQNSLIPNEVTLTTEKNTILNVESLDFYNNTSAEVIIIDDTEYIKTWGDNTYAQLGTGSVKDEYLPTTIITTEVGMIDVFSNNGLTMEAAIKNETGQDTLYGWGYNGYGELGFNGANFVFTPQMLDLNFDGSYNEGDITALSGDMGTTGVVANNQLYMSGMNAQGQLGNGTTFDRNNYEIVTLPEGTINGLNLDFINSSSVLIDNQLYGWGDNFFGQLAQGNTDKYLRPTLIETASLGTINQIATGGGSLFVLISNGNNQIVYGTGANLNSELAMGGAYQGLYLSLTPSVIQTYNPIIDASALTINSLTSSSLYLNYDFKMNGANGVIVELLTEDNVVLQQNDGETINDILSGYFYIGDLNSGTTYTYEIRVYFTRPGSSQREYFETTNITFTTLE